MTMSVVSTLVGFVQAICADCPVFCLADPDARVGEVFFADAHPAEEPDVPFPRQRTQRATKKKMRKRKDARKRRRSNRKR